MVLNFLVHRAHVVAEVAHLPEGAVAELTFVVASVLVHSTHVLIAVVLRFEGTRAAGARKHSGVLIPSKTS